MKKLTIVFFVGFLLVGLISVNGSAHEMEDLPFFQQVRQLGQEYQKTNDHLYQVTPTHPDSVYIGYEREFWRYDLSIMPPTWIRVQATCQGIGEHCYVFVENAEWGENMDEDDVEMIIYNFDESVPNDSTRGIYQLNVDNFGPPSDVDEDPHIYLFYSALGSFGGSVFDGYFSWFDLLTEEEAQEIRLYGNVYAHSNECEMIYMSCNPIDPADSTRLAVMAHEFEHMIHWNWDSDEELWIDEGCAEYAMFLYGYPDPIVDFPEDPDNNLIEWGQQFSDYIQTYLWMMYLHDHYGGPEILSTLVAQPENSIEGIEVTLDSLGSEATFREIFHDWAAANYIDDTTVGDGRYGYYNVELPPFFSSAYHFMLPVEEYGEVTNWAADYIYFDMTEVDEPLLMFTFEGEYGGVFGLQLLHLSQDMTWEVQEVPLDDGMGGIVIENTDDLQSVVAVITNEDSAAVGYYAYFMEETTDIDNHKTLHTPSVVNLHQNYPNPFNPTTTIQFDIPVNTNQPVHLNIYNTAGELVKTLVNEPLEAGIHTVTWDGTNENDRAVSSGIYFYRLDVENRSITKEAVLLK